MFWFAGLVGMAIESKRVRHWLMSPTLSAAKRSTLDEDLEIVAHTTPSMNPFPALVIGITGAAMAAHGQRYLFQVGLLGISS